MIFYAISHRKLEAGGRLDAQIERYIRLGADWIQIREKDLSDGDLFEAARATVKKAAEAGIQVFINGRADIAPLSGAAGVQLPSVSVPAARVKSFFPELLVVKSCHTIEDILDAEAEGVDSVTVGPVFATPSKEGIIEPIGIDGLKNICSMCRKPVIALGGMELGNIGLIREAGAAGAAGIRMFNGVGKNEEEPFCASLSGFRDGTGGLADRLCRRS